MVLFVSCSFLAMASDPGNMFEGLVKKNTGLRTE
jgi:hypothetical protein